MRWIDSDKDPTLVAPVQKAYINVTAVAADEEKSIVTSISYLFFRILVKNGRKPGEAKIIIVQPVGDDAKKVSYSPGSKSSSQVSCRLPVVA